MLVILTLISAVSMLDRQVITILAVDIKRDLQIGNAEIGLIYGTVFSVFYSLFAIPMGRLADGWVRTRQIASCLVVWSVATIGCGLSAGVAQLATWRSVVAVGEAGAGPASNSMVADLFPKTLRGTAFAILMSAATLGLGLSTIFGGLVIGWWNSQFPGGIGWFGLSGWRATFIAAAIPGLTLAVVIFFLREPRRGAADGVVTPPAHKPVRTAAFEILPLLPIVNIWAAARNGTSRKDIVQLISLLFGMTLFALLCVTALSWIAPVDASDVYGHLLGVPMTSHIVQSVMLAFGLHAAFSWMLAQRRNDPAAFSTMWSKPIFPSLVIIVTAQVCMAYGFNAFAAPYAMQTYGATPAEVGKQIGLVTLACGFAGTILGGMLGDWMSRRTVLGRQLVMLVSILGAPPFALMALNQTNLADYVVYYGIFLFLTGAWYPCCMASIADTMPPHLRGLATAVTYLSFTILGLGIGPYAVGLTSDATNDLGFAMAAIFLVTPLSIAALAVVMKATRASASTR
ncbi:MULTISPECIES: MFS transporter [unclassified Sphingobium]|uniref:MFS transporter n=1 Tax=unclassified Sphingobium TaxID=2611147 RepID=UPI00222575B2|nr:MULTISPECIES: MFS transporter [unclassified Sphingobium]MCW2411558.1 MFS family permease [Sphingobium sp. B8D3D]MCW2416149.1 MFS family permease [Sphingobium sp. B8D3A]